MEPVLYEKIHTLQQRHWWYKSRERFLDVLLRDFERGNGSVLDAGCGPGSMLHYFGRYGTVTGFDRYFPALQMCRGHFSGALIQGDCSASPFADGSFTLVAACEVLYHRQIGDVAAAVREFARILQPGGGLLLVDSAYAGCYSDHDVAFHGARRFNREELIAIMEAAGIEVVRATYAYALLLPVVWLIRWLKGVFGLKGHGGELHGTWGPLNSFIIRCFSLEAKIAGRWGLPFGLSVQVFGRKPHRGEPATAAESFDAHPAA